MSSNLIPVTIHTSHTHTLTGWRNGSASDSSPEGYEFESHTGHHTHTRSIGATAARQIPVLKVMSSNLISITNTHGPSDVEATYQISILIPRVRFPAGVRTSWGPALPAGRLPWPSLGGRRRAPLVTLQGAAPCIIHLDRLAQRQRVRFQS